MTYMTFDCSFRLPVEPSRCPSCRATKAPKRWWRLNRAGRRTHRSSPMSRYKICRDSWHGVVVVKGITA